MEWAGGQQAGGLVHSGQGGCRLTNLRLIKQGRDADWKLGTICHVLRSGLVARNLGLRLVGLDRNLTLQRLQTAISLVVRAGFSLGRNGNNFGVIITVMCG